MGIWSIRNSDSGKHFTEPTKSSTYRFKVTIREHLCAVGRTRFRQLAGILATVSLAAQAGRTSSQVS